RYSPLKSFTLSTNFTDISHASIEKAELQHPQGYKISEENIIISPERLSVSYNDPAEFKIKLKIPEEAIAGEYSGKVTFEIREASATLAIRVSVSSWLKITGNPVDFGEVQAGKESEDKPFTLTSNLPELAEVAVKKYDLIDDKGHKILKDKVIISPERLQVSAAFPQRFSLRIKVPEGTPEGKYEGKISFLIGGREKISLPARVKVIPFPAVTLLPLYPDKPLRHQPLRIVAKLTPPESEILEIPVEVTYPDATLHPLILRREQKEIFSNKGEEFKPTKIGEYTFAIQPSKDYQIKNGRQRIKVTPPAITISPKSANFGRLKKGEERRISFTLRAEKGRIFGPEPLHITISGAKDYLRQMGIADKVSLSLNKPSVTLSPGYLSDSFELTLKSPQQLPWRAYSTNLIVNRPDAEAKEISLTIKGPFPWRAVRNIILAVILVPSAIILTIKGWKKAIESIHHIPRAGEVIPVNLEESEPVRIGRDKRSNPGKNDIRLWDDSVSLTHAEIKKEDDKLSIRRVEGSLYVNAEPVEERATIKDKDKIKGIGDFEFEVVIDEEGAVKLDVIKAPED
ncbi:FHA domain-containing protein, partial [candidate division NPL-UPA2 bacterium]|nr:FHA domain-containing protein [candidate division NPL-UPA2 bacterium]